MALRGARVHKGRMVPVPDTRGRTPHGPAALRRMLAVALALLLAIMPGGVPAFAVPLQAPATKDRETGLHDAAHNVSPTWGTGRQHHRDFPAHTVLPAATPPVDDRAARDDAPGDGGEQGHRHGNGPSCCVASVCPSLPAPPPTALVYAAPRFVALRPWLLASGLPDGTTPRPDLPPPRARA